MVKWEYRKEMMSAYMDSFEADLNEFGQDGWELIKFIPDYDKSATKTDLAIFKRQFIIKIDEPFA